MAIILRPAINLTASSGRALAIDGFDCLRFGSLLRVIAAMQDPLAVQATLAHSRSLPTKLMPQPNLRY